jgi:6-pyruvoyltetrahydropterin/6-carboxytetrahydropterin synthase
MRVELWREYRFEAAHCLPRVPEEHKCRRLHGHSYRIELLLAGEVDPRTGWLMDFASVDEATRPVIERIDHRVLNEVPGLENPTSENLAAWLFRELSRSLPTLSAVSVWETPDARCTYRGE